MAFSYIGSFAGGFADGFLAAYQARTQRRYYDAMTQYYRFIMLRQNYNPDTRTFWDYKKQSWSSPIWQPNPDDDNSAGGLLRRALAGQPPNTGSMPLPGTGETSAPSGAKYSFAQLDQFALNAGFKGNDAAHMAALSMAESGGRTDRVGSAGEIGLTQINPHAWPQLMDLARSGPQGMFDAAYQIYTKAGNKFSDWSTDPTSPNYTPNNDGVKKYYNLALSAMPSTSGGSGAGPKEGQMSPSGGPYVKSGDQLYETDADGKIKPTPVSAQPSAAATPQAAETTSPGGRFMLPGLGGGPTIGSSPIPTPEGKSQVAQQSDLQAGNARSPLSRDPYWRSNPPLQAQPQQAKPQPGPDLAQRVPLDQTPLPPRRPDAQAAPAAPAASEPPGTNFVRPGPPAPSPVTMPARPYTPTPPTAGPPYAANTPAPPSVASRAPTGPPEPPKLSPPEAPAPSGGGGGGGQWTPEPDVQVAVTPYIDPWMDFQQQNPYATPISFGPPPQESRKGGPIGYDDGGDVSKPRSPIGKLSDALKDVDFTGGSKPDPSPDAPVNVPSYIDAWAGYKPQTGYADGGDIEPEEGPPGMLNPSYPMALTGLANTAIRNAPAAVRAFSDPNNPTGPTAANMGTQLRNVGTALALPVITRDLLRGLYTNPQQMQPRTGVPAPMPGGARPDAPQPMNRAAQYPSPDEYNRVEPVWSGSPMGAVGTAVQPYSPTIGNAIIKTGNAVDNFVDWLMPMNDQLKAQHDWQNNFNDQVREQNTQLTRVYHPREENWRQEQEQRELETPEREVQWQRTYMVPAKRAQAEQARQAKQQKHARGGPVMGYAKGGTVVKLQGGGNPATWGSYNQNPTPWLTPTPTPYQTFQPDVGQPLPTVQPSQMGGLASQGAYYNQNLGYQPWNNIQWLGSQPTSPNSMPLTGQAMYDDIQALAPAQQRWYNQQMADQAAAGGRGKWYYNPASYAEISTPAKTTTTPTPTPQARQLTSFIPPTPASTTGITAANTAVNVPGTSNTTPTFGSGANATNANAIQSATNYTHYADGGDVGPSTLGPPPGLGGGQGQAIPPIYYNPATYSQAGAPVGKGFSNNSVPVYVAAPVPTYMRGGVVGYDDGGDVDQGPTIDSSADTSQADMPSPVAQPVSFTGGRTPAIHLPTPRGIRPPRPSMSIGRSQQGGGGGFPVEQVDENNPQTWSNPVAKPADAPPEAPQIYDSTGQNLSSGMTGAIAAGLHGLARFLQMGPWQSGVPDQQTSANRRDFTAGVGAAPPQKVEAVENAIDPDMALGQSQRLMGAMETVYKWHLLNGDPEGAQRDMASILMYARLMAHEHAGAAIKAYYQGDKDAMLSQLQQANNFVPNGQNIYHSENKDGTVHVESRNADNSLVNWEANVGPQQILAAAWKVYDGSAFWQEMEQVAYKYDPVSKAMVDQRAEAAGQQALQAAMPERQYGPPPPQGSQPPQGPQAPQGPQQTPAAYQPSPMGGAPTIGSPGPLPSAGSPVPLPPTMVGPAGAAQQMTAPTGIGAQPGQPPATRADIQGGLTPQVAEEGPGPGALPSYNPSFDTTGAGAIPPPPPSPVPVRPDTTTAQPATPPPTSDQRLDVTPAASSAALRPDTIAQPNVTPMPDSEFYHRAEQIATEERNKVLFNNEPIMENGRPWHYPELDMSKLPADPKLRTQALAFIKNEQQEWRNAWTHANDTAKAMTASRTKDLSDQLGVARTLFDAEKSRRAAAELEANKEQATANAEMVKAEAARMKPRPDEFVDSNGQRQAIGVLSRPAVLNAFGVTEDKNTTATQLHPYLKSQESMNSVVDGTSAAWQYNHNLGMERAASLVKAMVTDPAWGMTFDKDGKQVPDKDAVQNVPVPGDPEDKRTMVRVRDPRGGFAHFVVPTDVYEDDLLKSHNEYIQGRSADNAQAELRAEAERERAKGRAAMAALPGEGASTAVNPFTGKPTAIQQPNVGSIFGGQGTPGPVTVPPAPPGSSPLAEPFRFITRPRPNTSPVPQRP